MACKYSLTPAQHRAQARRLRQWRPDSRAAELHELAAKMKERLPAAHDLLAPVYGWFTEAFDTLDFKEAKALLDEQRFGLLH